MAKKHPNILFFFTDDQRFNTINALGNPHIHTPALDRLVQRGTSFTNAYIMGGTCGAVCMPSRAMLMTGRTLFHIDGSGERVPSDHALLGETLRNAGYRTFGTGKWHNGPEAYARSFTDGDEIFFGGMNDHWNVPAYHFDPSGKYDTFLPQCIDYWNSNGLKDRQCDHVTAGKHSSELFSDAAIKFLNSYNDDVPFFMYISFMAPHDPRTMPEEFRKMYDPDTISLPPNFKGAHPFDNGELKIRDEKLEDWPRTPEAIRKHIAEYYAMITHADAQIGRVAAKLEETGRANDTIIVFAGDNGLAVGQHGLMGKQSLYEHSVHVPLIMSGPGIPVGEKREAFCYLFDIFPTLCDLGGIAIPESVEGVSLVNALQNPQEHIRDTLYFAYKGNQRGIRDDKFKLIEYVVNRRRTTQLFDLHNDQHELTNLVSDKKHEARVFELRKKLAEWRERIDDNREQGRSFWAGHTRY